MVVAETPQYWDKNEILLINPLLIVEVLSKSTRKYDRSDKFDEYKTLTSFKEYVLIDPDHCRVETRYRAEPNLWRDAVAKSLSDVILLKSIDCGIDMSMIYRKVVFQK